MITSYEALKPRSLKVDLRLTLTLDYRYVHGLSDLLYSVVLTLHYIGVILSQRTMLICNNCELLNSAEQNEAKIVVFRSRAVNISSFNISFQEVLIVTL